MPVAANCLVVPGEIVWFAGATAIEVRAGTVSVAEPVFPPKAALMVATPPALACTVVAAPVLAPIVATLVLLELQAALLGGPPLVTSRVVWSLKTAMAVYGTVVPGSAENFAGITAMSTTIGAVTVRMVELGVRAPMLAVIVELPTPRVCANPVATPIAATLVFVEVQLANVVTSWVLLSL